MGKDRGERLRGKAVLKDRGERSRGKIEGKVRGERSRGKVLVSSPIVPGP